MTGANFHILFYIVLSLFISGLFLFTIGFFKKEVLKNVGLLICSIGIGIIGAYIIYIWNLLERPPMRTLGETRLWYAFFNAFIGFFIYYRWKSQKAFSFLIFGYSVLMSMLFLFINYMHPETFNKNLMPALQSYWFVPHVIVYMFAYSILGISTIIAIWGLIIFYNNKFDKEILYLADNTVYIGFTFLTLGLLFGALWAKEAWGSYWTWDPKETWAFLTWLGYLLYIHLRIRHKNSIKGPLFVLSLIFVVLIMCWFGINYLPSAQNSVHVYSN